MPLIATDTLRYSHLVKHEYEPSLGFCREMVTVNETAAKTYAVGTVLGKITASGKYVIAKETAVDGSKVPAALVVEDKAVAATTDTKVLVLVRGQAIVSKKALKLDTTYDTDPKKQVAYDAIKALGILVNETV